MGPHMLFPWRLFPSSRGFRRRKSTSSSTTTALYRRRCFCERLEVRNLLAGTDFNNDNFVDAADYVIWQDTKGQTVTPFTGADVDGSGVVDDGDYGRWRQNYGQSVADLEIESITDNPDPVLNGEFVTYRVTATNHGPNSADLVRLEFEAGAGLAITSVTTSFSPSFSSIDPGGAKAYLYLTDRMLSETPLVIDVVASANASGHDMPFAAEFSAIVTSPVVLDLNIFNNIKRTTTTVEPAPVADLQIATILDNPDPVLVSQPVTYFVIVHNNGPSTAHNISLSFSAGGGLRITSVDVAGATISPSGNAAQCMISSLASGEDSSVIHVGASTNNGGGNITFTTLFFAFALSPVQDPDLMNNFAQEETTIELPAGGAASLASSEINSPHEGSARLIHSSSERTVPQPNINVGGISPVRASVILTASSLLARGTIDTQSNRAKCDKTLRHVDVVDSMGPTSLSVSLKVRHREIERFSRNSDVADDVFADWGGRLVLSY